MHRFIVLALVVFLSSWLGCGSNSDDGTADSGTPGAYDSAPPEDAEPDRRRVFVSSARFSGNLGGLAGGDSSCQGLADVAGLGGEWKAWLSTSEVNATDRIVDVSPWYLVDRETLAFAVFGQLRGEPSHVIDQDENGSVVDSLTPSDQVVWTGTVNGSGENTFSCDAFTTDRTTTSAAYGQIDIPRHWSSVGLLNCDATNLRIYCFEQ